MSPFMSASHSDSAYLKPPLLSRQPAKSLLPPSPTMPQAIVLLQRPLYDPLHSLILSLSLAYSPPLSHPYPSPATPCHHHHIILDGGSGGITTPCASAAVCSEGSGNGANERQSERRGGSVDAGEKADGETGAMCGVGGGFRG